MEIIDSCICKAKRVDNGEWVEGYFTMNPNSKIAYITDMVAGCAHPCRIDVSKICRCTGRRDANDRLIFEGDILSVFDEICDEQYRFIVKYGICGGIVNVTHKVGYIGFYLDGYDDETKRCSSLGLRNDILYWLNGYKCYVVGNIYD